MQTITNVSNVDDYSGEEPVATPSNPVTTTIDSCNRTCCRRCDCNESCSCCRRCRLRCDCCRCDSDCCERRCERCGCCNQS